MFSIANGYGELVLHPTIPGATTMLEVWSVCEEGIAAQFDDDGVADYMREKIPEIQEQGCSNKFLITAFVKTARELKEDKP